MESLISEASNAPAAAIANTIQEEIQPAQEEIQPIGEEEEEIQPGQSEIQAVGEEEEEIQPAQSEIQPVAGEEGEEEEEEEEVRDRVGQGQGQGQQEPSTNPIQTTSSGGQLARTLFHFLFYLHLILILGLVIYVLTSSSHNRHFQRTKFYPPLFASIACSTAVALVWQWVTRSSPSKAFKAAFWLSPLLTCALGALFIAIGSIPSQPLGELAVICGGIQSLYAYWVSSRFEYAIHLLLVSTEFPPPKTTTLVGVSILASILYSCLLVSGIGEATASASNWKAWFIPVILLSMAWTMQVIKNTLIVAVSHVKYRHWASGMEVSTLSAFRESFTDFLGNICIGSIMVPVLGVIRGSVRGMELVAGDKFEFLFSDYFSEVATKLMLLGNRWGFVHVGVHNMDFVLASSDTWELLRNAELEELINTDLTGTFCFLSGVAAGSFCSLVSGAWVLAIHKSYAIQVSIYAFIIAYLMCRIALAWLQACVSAYYVAYAANRSSPRMDNTIPVRLQELRRIQQ